MARGYTPRAKRGSKSRFKPLTFSNTGGSYDGKPTEDDPRWNPKTQGNRRGHKGPRPSSRSYRSPRYQNS